MARDSEVKKIVLAYSGGLDTSVMLHWLKEKYGCPILAFVADVGQGEDLPSIEKKAYETGADKVVISDLRNNSSGFPDLVHFPAVGGYRLIEVKGPGDSLQKNQQRWMQYFHQHGIPHQLARVTWQTN